MEYIHLPYPVWSHERSDELLELIRAMGYIPVKDYPPKEQQGSREDAIRAIQDLYRSRGGLVEFHIEVDDKLVTSLEWMNCPHVFYPLERCEGKAEFFLEETMEPLGYGNKATVYMYKDGERKDLVIHEVV